MHLGEGTRRGQDSYAKKLEDQYYILGKNCFFGQASGNGIELELGVTKNYLCGFHKFGC